MSNSDSKNNDATYELMHDSRFSELLFKEGISVALSTYQAGKVIVLSALSSEKTIQLPRTFSNAMGMAVDKDMMAIATKSTLEVLKYSENAALGYPGHPEVYDGLFLPRISYHTGYLALHDMVFIGQKLMAVNTMFSAICSFSENNSFDTEWKPSFISELKPEDRCHLNGMATENGVIKYVTALGRTDTVQGWRDNKMNGGILMEYPSGKILLDGLAMPHSPRIYDGKLYVLNSARGTLLEVDRENGNTKEIANIGAFARGMDKCGDYLFIGTSKLRHTNEVFKSLPIAETSFAGVVVVHLPSGEIAATVKYESSIEEIYDVKVLANKRRPNILSPAMDVQEQSIILESQAFWTAKDEKKEEKQESNTSPNKQTDLQLNTYKNTTPEELVQLFGNMLSNRLIDAIKKQQTSRKLNLIVVSKKDIPVGLGVFEAKNDKSAKLWSVFVKTEFQKRGLGKQLIDHMVKILEQNGINYIEAVIASGDDTAAANALLKNYPDINLIAE